MKDRIGFEQIGSVNYKVHSDHLNKSLSSEADLIDQTGTSSFKINNRDFPTFMSNFKNRCVLLTVAYRLTLKNIVYFLLSISDN